MSINRVFIGLVLFFSFWMANSACNDPNPRLPLYEEEVNILTDAMLVESVLQDFTGIKKDSLAKLNYNVLYDRHGISEVELQEIRERYSNDPTLWSRAADSVEARLKRGRTDFETLLNPELN